jgi:fluoride exporter
MPRLILIGFAGLIGTLARFGLSEVAAKRLGTSFPIGTLIVNILGCFLGGILFYALQERTFVSETVRLAVIVGFLGGFTTFSAFGVQTFVLLKNGEVGLGLLNVAVSNLFGIAVVWVGYAIAKLALP